MACSGAPIRAGGFPVLRKKNSIQHRLLACLADRSGATAIEYGLIIGIISGALILGLESVRDNLQAVFQLIITTLTNAMP